MCRDRERCKKVIAYFARPIVWVIIAFILGIIFGWIFSRQSQIDLPNSQSLQFFNLLGQLGLGGFVSILAAIIVALRLAASTEKLLSEDGDVNQKRDGEVRAKAFSVVSAIGSFFVAGFVFGAVITVTIRQNDICEAIIAVAVLLVTLFLYRMILSYYQERTPQPPKKRREPQRYSKAGHRPQRPRNASQRRDAAQGCP